MIKLNFKPKRFQQEIIDACFNDNLKRVVVTASRQVGKSIVMRYIMLKWLLKKRVECAYLSPTNKLNNKVFQKFSGMLPKQLVRKVNSTLLEISFVNGSTISFLSGESIGNCRGLTLDYLIVDECAFIKEYTPDGQHWWNNICSPFLDAKDGKAVFISTPRGSQGFYYKQVLEAQKNGSYIKCTIWDDETKTKEWIENKRKDYPELAWKQEYECAFISNGISYFTKFNLTPGAELKMLGKCWGGIDFSTSGEDATVFTIVDEDNNVRCYEIKGSLDCKYDRIANLINSRNFISVNAEKNSMGEVMINEIKKRLNNKTVLKSFVTTNQSKADGIHNLALLLENDTLKYDDIELHNQLGTYCMTRSKSGLEVFNALPGYHDDYVMSLMLALEAKRIKTDNVGINIFRR